MELMKSIKKTSDAVEKALAPLPANSMDMDILDKLKQEHDEVKEMLAQLVESESPTERKMLLKKIKGALVPHERAEEKIVYNAIIAQKDKDAKIDGKEGYVEHDLADQTLTKLSKIANADSPEFLAAAKVFKELLEHHIEEEESNVWKDVREYFGSDEREGMNRKFELLKKKIRAA